MRNRFAMLLLAAALLAPAPARSAEAPAPAPAPSQVVVQLTDEEAQVLINLIDISVKASGLQAAASGAFLAGKIAAARKAAEKKE